MTQPFVKWAGGKRQLMNDIMTRIPNNYNRYIEPFIGGGAIFLALEPENAIINDVNEELINCYRVIRDSVDELINVLRIHSINGNNSEYFYNIRGLDRSEKYFNLTDEQRAARMIYLNRTCFNGLYRVNRKNQFNVPFGKYINPRILDEELIREVSGYLNRADVNIMNGNYVDVLEQCSEGDFVYLDPPYYPLNATSNFTSYTAEGFADEQQIELKRQCDILTQNGVKFLQSNSNTEFINELYSEYIIEFVDARRNINRNANARGGVSEVLIRNY